MNRFSIISRLMASAATLACLPGPDRVQADSQTNRVIAHVESFELHDQYGQRHQCRFPTTHLTLVAVADRKGSTQIESWVQPVRQRYGTNIAIEGVADVSAVPSPLRSLVTRNFKKAIPHPVMLDWTGTVCRQFAYRGGQVHVFILDQQGKILKRWAGPANERTLSELFAELDRART